MQCLTAVTIVTLLCFVAAVPTMKQEVSQLVKAIKPTNHQPSTNITTCITKAIPQIIACFSGHEDSTQEHSDEYWQLGVIRCQCSGELLPPNEEFLPSSEELVPSREELVSPSEESQSSSEESPSCSEESRSSSEEKDDPAECVIKALIELAKCLIAE